MVRWVAILVLLPVVAGCGEDRRPRAVPVAPTSAAHRDEAAARPVTRPPRAIATH